MSLEKNLHLECEKMVREDEPPRVVALPLKFDSDDMMLRPTGGNQTRWFKVELAWEADGGRRRKVVRAHESGEILATGEWSAVEQA